MKGGAEVDKDFFIIRRMKHGDEAAVDDFVKLYYGEIYKYCYYKLNDKWLAEDITQDAFTRFFGHFNNYIHKGKAKNYLYVIAGNLCKNQYKKHKEESIDLMEEQLTNSKVEQDELTLKEGIMQEISRLSEDFKEVVLLHYFQNLKLREIAEILDIKLSLVKYRLSEGKKFLKNSMDKEDFYE